MRAALKVLNDSLKKTSATLLPRTQLKQAIDIVREEWFKVIIIIIVQRLSRICGGVLGEKTQIIFTISIENEQYGNCFLGVELEQLRWPPRQKLHQLVHVLLAGIVGIHHQHDRRCGKYYYCFFVINKTLVS